MDELGTCLRTWRDRLDPADVGLDATSRRRAPGLRREEVARLARIYLQPAHLSWSKEEQIHPHVHGGPD